LTPAKCVRCLVATLARGDGLGVCEGCRLNMSRRETLAAVRAARRSRRIARGGA